MNPQVPRSHSVQFQLLRKAVAFDSVVYITGLPSVGKTTLTKVLLDENENHCVTAYIDCHYAINASKLYLDILDQFNEKYGTDKIKRKFSKNITFIEFMELCHEFRKAKKKAKVLIALDHVEMIKKTVLVDSLVALLTMTRTNLILVGNESAIQVVEYIKHAQPMKMRLLDRLNVVEIPPFSVKETEDFIREHLPSRDGDLYEKFVANVVKLVYPVNTKDYLEIKTFCQQNFQDFLKHYDERVEEFRDKYGKTKKLPETFVGGVFTTFFKSFRSVLLKKDMMSWNTVNLDTKVCLGTSLMIFAAYIAAHTRPSADKINFVRFQKRLAKRKLNHKGDIDATPKEFTLERLIHIYKGLSSLTRGRPEAGEEEEEDFSDYSDATMLGDIQLLEDLNMIRATAGNRLDTHTRYKLSGVVPAIFYERIALQLELPLHQIYGLPFTSETKSILMGKTK